DSEEFERRQAALHAELLAPTVPTEKKPWWPWALGVIIVGAAAGLYAWLGNPAGINTPMPSPAVTAMPGAGSMTEKPGSGGDLKTMADRLAEKLAKDPNNAEGWTLLAQTYLELRQHKKADEAFAKASSLGTVNAKLLADWADAHVVANNRKWDQTAKDLVARALKADPKSLKALALAGSEAFDRTDYTQAITHWKKMREVAPPGSMDAKLADANIEEATAVMSGKRPTTPAAGGSSIAGTVVLDPALKGKVAPTDTVFVIARATDGSAPPLAVRRFTAADFPISFSLSDSDAMVPTRTLARFGEAQLTARISKSGNPMPQPDDINSRPLNVKMGAADVRLELPARP
ncbi:MAG TPA: tetratricopeptide repeat protein, partial [Rhodocyclaceae bacterium]|nr:tetratricopeptide repeat protein [Rhodocyclaceae bacterium]